MSPAVPGLNCKPMSMGVAHLTGMFVTADTRAKCQGARLEMTPAVNRFKQASREIEALNNAAEAAKVLVSDIRT